MQLFVNPSQRHAKMRAHTATHLLHALIHHYIPTTQQAGSLVDNDYVRFDYTSDEMLTPAQINEINIKINEIIGLARDVTTTEMNIEQALATGAKAFFQDKYGDVVRVVQVHPAGTSSASHETEFTSVELCGGTHVSNTREIGAFVIVEQSPVASGTKRIVAYTGPKTLEYSSSLEFNLQSIATKLDCSPKQIDERLSKTLKDFEELKVQTESNNFNNIKLVLDSSELKEDNGYKMISVSNNQSLKNIDIKDVVNVARQLNKSIIIVYPDWKYAIVTGSEVGLNAKEYAIKKGRKGGGNEVIFQGKDNEVLNAINSYI